jgi:hypothetical protein
VPWPLFDEEVEKVGVITSGCPLPALRCGCVS